MAAKLCELGIFEGLSIHINMFYTSIHSLVKSRSLTVQIQINLMHQLANVLFPH